MRRTSFILLFVSSVFWPNACSGNLHTEDCITYNAEYISDVPAIDISTHFVCNTGEVMNNIAIHDSILFVFSQRRENVATLYNLNSLNPIGSYCPRGRASNEILANAPVKAIYQHKDSVFCPLFSYIDSKLFMWDVTKTIETGLTDYKYVMQIKTESGDIMPVSSYYLIDSSRMIVHNTNQDAYRNEMIKTPAYLIYDLNSGELLREFPLFCMIDSYEGDSGYSAKNFLSLSDCIKPDHSKIAFGMSYHPMLSILDIGTGMANGFIIRGAKQFSAKEKYWNFTSVKCDDDFIYALYYGDVYNPSETNIPNILYVFDWDGNIVAKCRTTERFSRLWVDKDKLYLFRGFDDALYVISTDEFKSIANGR